MLTTVYLNLQGWHQGSCDQTEREKHEQEKIPPNLAMALGSRFDKFITGYETRFSKNSSLQNKYVIHVHLYKISE